MQSTLMGTGFINLTKASQESNHSISMEMKLRKEILANR